MAKAPFDGVDRKGKGRLKLDVLEELKNGNRCIIGPVRLSYLNVFKVRRNKDRDVDEFSVSALIDKGDDQILEFVEEQVDIAVERKFGKLIPKFNSCLYDGDEETDNDNDPKAPGCMFIATRADEDKPPVLISPEGKELNVSDARHWSSGDWGYLKLDFFGYDTKNKGASTRLLAVQFCAKDESFGGPAEQDPDKVKKEFGGAVDGVDEKYQRARDEDSDERSSRRRERGDRSERSSRGGDDERSERRSRDRDSDDSDSGGRRRRSFMD